MHKVDAAIPTHCTLMHTPTSMVVEVSSCCTDSQCCCSGVIKGLTPSFLNFISLYCTYIHTHSEGELLRCSSRNAYKQFTRL